MSSLEKKVMLHKLLRLPRIFSSVFTKLLLISIVTWFLIVFAVVVTLIFSKHNRKGSFYRNADLYIQYIIKDIGSPPVKEKAEKLSRKAGINISYRGRDEQWTTNSTFPEVDNIRFRRLNGKERLRYGRDSDHRFLRLKTENGTLFFEFAETEDEKKEFNRVHLCIFLFLSLILFGSYFAIKRVLRPIKWVNTGVQQVKEGNLNHLVPIQGNNEFTDIARSFNQMTEKLRLLVTTKENLLRDVSHELRSPLTRMRVALAMLDETVEKQDIEADIEEMEAMIKAILETARHHHNFDLTELKKHELNELILSVADKYRTIGSGVIFARTPRPLYCYVDQSSIQTVISNCIDNSLKYSQESSEPITIELSKEKNHAIITIRDTGAGIDETQLPYIFEPFYRIDPSRSRKSGGYGLGLSICKKIIESHGGTISVQSVKDQGTIITIQLDLSRSAL